MGHQVTLAARAPRRDRPPARRRRRADAAAVDHEADELTRLVEITAAAIAEATGVAPEPAAGRLALVRAEVGLARAAHGAVPIVGDVGERGSGRDAAVGIAVGRVVDEPAGLADPLLHGFGGSWREQPSIGRRVEFDRPDREELNPGAPTVPRQAASVIVLRAGARRHGGAAGAPQPRCAVHGRRVGVPRRAAGRPATARARPPTGRPPCASSRRRPGLRLPDPAALVKFSRWITPPQFMIRFDTHFFLAAAPPGQEPRVDGHECSTWPGARRPAALAAHRARRARARLPDLSSSSSSLSAFTSVPALLEWATGREILTVEPQVQLTGETARVVLPDEPAS